MLSRMIRTHSVRSMAVLTVSAGLVFTVAGSASAHMGVDLRGGTPTAGTSSTLMFRPGHGCDGDATNAVTITIPEGIATTAVKAQPKSGWKLSRTANTITWSSGELPDDQFDEFGLRVSWPALPSGSTSTKYYFKAVQNCNAELKVERSRKAATITGYLPRHAGESVTLFVDDRLLTAHDVTVGSDGRFTVVTTSRNVPPGAEVTARSGDRLVGTSTAAVEAWVDVPTDGSAASLASPAPAVTVVAPATAR